MKNVLAKFGIAVFMIMVLFGAVNAQEDVEEPLECQVMGAEDAHTFFDGEQITIQEDMNLNENSTVVTAPEGYIILMCNDGFREVSNDLEGDLAEVSQKTEEMEADIPEIEEDVDLEEALTRTDEIEENLGEINQVIEEAVPDRIASVIMGDRVNFQVGDVTIGIATNESGITGVEEGGYEDPTLEIETSEESIRQIIESENAPETFREAYHGDGIDVEARSMRNKIVFGVANTASRVYGFVNRFI